MEMSERLHAVASLVTAGNTAADVGCDHGYVAIWLLENHICPKVIAMDVNKGPLERARENIQIYGFVDYIETRLSNGTKALHNHEVDTLICAGMGGKLMVQILQEGMDKVLNMKELVLQPQSELREMRTFLRTHGMRIVAENMVQDEDKFYPMMKVAVEANTQTMNQAEKLDEQKDISEEISWQQRMEDTYGPFLLKESHPILKAFLQKRTEICTTILEQLQQQADKNERQLARIEEIKEEMRDMDKVLQQYF